MKKIVIFIFAIFMSFSGFSQDRFHFNYSKEYDSILNQTKDFTSSVYFGKLFQRFEDADTTLSNFDMIAMQIGYTDNEKYWPYKDIYLEREIWKLIEEMKFEQAQKQIGALLHNNPFSIVGNWAMSYVYYQLGDNEKAQTYFNKYEMVVTSVLASGEGTSYESSWFTLSPADGQWIIKLSFEEEICSMGSGRDKNGNFHDILGATLGESQTCTPLYFNIQPAAKRMFGPEGLMFDDTKKRDKLKKIGGKRKS
jgi:hypothetical protein